MSFRIEFVAREEGARHPQHEEPEVSGDYEVDVMAACGLIAQASAGEFVLAGFGRDRWPLDVVYDMSSFMEQFPRLLQAARTGEDVELDLYGQGIESSLSFRPHGDDVEIHCLSRTSWQPSPPVESIARARLVTMLEDLAKSMSVTLSTIAPRLAADAPFRHWSQGIV
ncbi:hypothetical protein ACFUMH_11970 [Cellulomonas sp. NPDC057328]|uniref:hypothetical protein n=1 Tax=Cellulomonas sp. NPDC057328 TaxID=3346101 RepID=UPI00362D8BA5